MKTVHSGHIIEYNCIFAFDFSFCFEIPLFVVPHIYRLLHIMQIISTSTLNLIMEVNIIKQQDYFILFFAICLYNLFKIKIKLISDHEFPTITYYI